MKLIYTQAAIDDILDIESYIRNFLGNKTAATRIKVAITKTCKRLKLFPHSGAQLSNIIECASDLRYFTCENWIVFYQVSDPEVRIIRVLDGRTDFVRVLTRHLNQQN